ncbi:Cytosol aminopeptidase [Lamellibrachia satsuma]|nr:Cytosol aminopeptidase [Lamellibrachia satsuma]
MPLPKEKRHGILYLQHACHVVTQSFSNHVLVKELMPISTLPGRLAFGFVATKQAHTFRLVRRAVASMSDKRRGLVLGVFEEENGVALTKSAQGFRDSKAPKLQELITLSGLAAKKGKCRVFCGLDETYSNVAVVALGKKGLGYNELEEVDEGRENVRSAVSAGVRVLREYGVSSVAIDPCGDAEAASEGAHLSLFSYDDLKAADKRKLAVDLTCYTDHSDSPDSTEGSWRRGALMAEGQNLACLLMESPANVMTPTRFAEVATEKLGNLQNVDVRIRDKAWAESQKMGAFLSVSRGSREELKFVEVEYRGGDANSPPIAIVGKGVTFDSGGISLKPPANMDAMRADMGGAACTLSAVYTAAKLHIPINVVALIPLCENMPSGCATKPGDVVTAMNGKTIQVDNTDAEGRLILCDALCYAETFQPRVILDMATLTGAMMVALGSGATGVFTNSTEVWQTMLKAGSRTGDRVWRMPLFKHYTKQITESQLADLNNIGGGREGGACTAAAFLKEFVSNKHWMHLDIAGVMSNKAEVSYLNKGMAGRPTRTIVEFLAEMSKQKNS